MENLHIAYQRLHAQHIASPTFNKPAEVVQWLGAVQAQDYAAAKWAIGLRLQNCKDVDLDQALAEGTILRTHLMRPTWHFVTPTDIRWILALTAPRVNAVNASYYRKYELDEAIFLRSETAIAQALQGQKQLTRPELMSVLQQANIAIDELRFTLIIMRAELDGIVCSGGRCGKQFTYALLDERAPQTKVIDRDEALAKLAERYFTGHGPATLQDFVWWSGLTTTDAKAGLAMVTSKLMSEVIDGQTYWFATSTPYPQNIAAAAHLLPNYDEYIVGYKDRSAVFDTSHTLKLDARSNILFSHTIVLDGKVIGTWQRTLQKKSVNLVAKTFIALNESENRALATAVEQYSQFMSCPVTLL